MCFSAPASFLSAGILTIIGALTVRHVRSKNKIMFALIPLLFALQQISEGFVWLAITTAIPIAKDLIASVFLGFALYLWPLWIPLSVLMLEQHKLRRMILLGFAFFGLVIAAYSFLFALYYGIEVTIINNNLVYTYHNASPISILNLIAYCTATIVPFFVVRNRLLHMFGILLLSSLILTYGIWYAAFISVWCFFAALLSIGVWYIVKRI